MNSSVVRPFFRTRFVAAMLSLAGFWICMAKVDYPQVSRGEDISEVASPFSDAAAGPGIHTVTGEIPAEVAEPVSPVVPVLVIDPGHGGADGGTVGNGLVEKDWTLKVGIALTEELRGRGHKVEMTRETDETLPLEQRPALVNAAPRVALLSIHFNAGTGDANGVETWYSWPKKPEIMARLHDADGVPVAGTSPDDSQRLALAVQAAVQGRTSSRDRGIKNRVDLAMTSRTVCPAILIECGFLSHGAESRRIQDTAWRKKLVRGIADGYESWLRERHSSPLSTPIPEGGAPTGGAGLDAEH